MIRTNPPSDLVLCGAHRSGHRTIYFALCKRPVRLDELGRALPAASKKSLTASLRSLEAARVVAEKRFERPPSCMSSIN